MRFGVSRPWLSKLVDVEINTAKWGETTITFKAADGQLPSRPRSRVFRMDWRADDVRG